MESKVDGVNYMLAYYDLDLNQEDLVQIAESVQ